MSRYSEIVSPSKTPQREQAREDQVANAAGGFVFALDKWKRLDRFLVLGTEGGTYYASERKHTKQAVAAVAECLREDGPRTVARIAEISDAGRAVKNDPAVYALAMCCGAADPATRRAALDAAASLEAQIEYLLERVEALEAWRKRVEDAAK